MKRETYINYIKYTLTTYNKSNKKALLKLFEDNNVAKKKNIQANLFDSDIVEVDYSNIDDSIIECIEKKIKQ